MAEPKDGGKRQASVSLDGGELDAFDEWLEYQKRVRGYTADRSFIVNTLLKRFNAVNRLTEDERQELQKLLVQTTLP